RHYNSDLDPASPTFGAAVLLLAGLEYGHNIDVLARKTGYDRAFVARVARRLIDNGVWKAGVTIADWSSTDEASGTFWNDVAVAEGKMCRRIGPDGRIEWAPAGFWNKNFQFIDPGAEGRLAALYLDPGPVDQPDADESAVIESVEAPVQATPPVPADRPVLPAAAELDENADTLIIGPMPASEIPRPQAPGSTSVPRLDEVFGNVIWIG
ncbi:MAG TPA: hypothetical protein VNI78_00920, partial [Vicinamibacterales bacterium]|nr:hypothetical protein [Vicinamibacterales bacterium]